MNKDMIYFGIDISKDVFDVMDSNNNYFQFKTIIKALKSF
jgi:transposase